MRMTASWFGSLDPPNTRLWRDRSAPESGLPSDRHPDRTKRAVVLGAVKVWPGKNGECRKVGATANLDSSGARRLCNTAGSGRRNGIPGQTKKPIKKASKERKSPLLKPLDNKDPIQGVPPALPTALPGQFDVDSSLQESRT